MLLSSDQELIYMQKNKFFEHDIIHKPLGLLAEIWQKGVKKVLNPLSTDKYSYRLFSLTSSIEGAIFKLINFYWTYF